MGRSLRVSQQQTHHLWSKMGLKLGSALLLFLPLLSLALANAAVEDDSKQDLVNPPANQVGVNQAGHDLVKRGAGRGRKSCEGKRCGKKKSPQKAKKKKKNPQKEKKKKKKKKKKK